MHTHSSRAHVLKCIVSNKQSHCIRAYLYIQAFIVVWLVCLGVHVPDVVAQFTEGGGEYIYGVLCMLPWFQYVLQL